MFQNNCRVINKNGYKFYEKDILYDDYIFNNNIQIDIDVTYITPGFGIVLMDDEGYSLNDKNTIYLFSIGYRSVNVYYVKNNIRTLLTQISTVNANTIQEHLKYTFIKKNKKIIIKLNNKLVLEQYLKAELDTYTIGYYSNSGNVINNINIASNTPDDWIINMENTNGGYIHFEDNSISILNCQNNAEIEEQKINLKAGKYYLNYKLEAINNLNDLKCYIFDSEATDIINMNKNILTADNSFILKEDKAINIKIIGKQGKISNLAINKNKYDNYIPTSSDISDKFSSIIFDLKNLRTISWRGIIQSVPLNDEYAIIQDDIASYDLLNKYMGLNKIELNKEYFYEYNVLSNRLRIYDSKKKSNLIAIRSYYTNISNTLTIFKNIDAIISELILIKKDGTIVNVNFQDELNISINADITSPIIVLDSNNKPFDLSAAYRIRHYEDNTKRYIFTNWEREYFKPSNLLSLENKLLNKDDTIRLYGIKDNEYNLDNIYDINTDNIHSLNMFSNTYDILSSKDILNIDSNTNQIMLKDKTINKYKLFIVDYLKYNSYAINFNYKNYTYDVSISTNNYSNVIYDIGNKKQFVLNDQEIKYTQMTDYKITDLTMNNTGYIVLRNGGI